jgi:hypothetical protein
MMRKYAYVASAFGLVLAAAVVISVHQGSSAHQGKWVAAALQGPLVVSADSTDAPPPRNNPDESITRSNESCAVDASAAVETAERGWRSGTLSSAKAIVVGEYRFTDPNMGEALVPPNALVWIVSADGIVQETPGAVPGSSAPPLIIHQMNFVIDANTGKQLVAYGGQMAPETAADARALASQLARARPKAGSLSAMARKTSAKRAAAAEAGKR